MKKNRKRKNLTLAIRSKARITQQSSLAAKRHHAPTHQNNPSNIQGWYQFRKRAQQRLRSLSNGNLHIHENGYRGDYQRHWIQSSQCEHVFRAGLKEVFTIGADKICPFCNVPNDMRRCGSIAAVQQMVECLSYGNIEFISENELRGPDDLYEFACLIHQFRFKGTYRNFIRSPENFCHICEFNKKYK